MGNEHNILRSNVILAHTILKTLHNTGSNATLVIMCSLNLIFTYYFMGFIIHCHALGVSPAYVNTHTNSPANTLCHNFHSFHSTIHARDSFIGDFHS